MEISESRAPLGAGSLRAATARTTAWAGAEPILLQEIPTVDALVQRLDSTGHVAVAEQVSAGLGPVPNVPPGAALWAAVAVDVDGVEPARLGWRTHAVALAAVDALRDAGRVPAEIVWPTTLSVPGAMCGGDAGTRSVGVVDVRPGASRSIVVATIGVLVALGTLELPKATTSIYADGGVIDRTALLATYLPALERRVAQWRDADPTLPNAYRDRCQTLGRLVDVDGREGRVRSVDDAGRLVVDLSGELVAVAADRPAPVLL
ncbi:MAG TPA: hypothetical protein VFL59_15125 [Candidatus Nanopelagicales bacterium]|nr:hypothetical protein [Candidatus Nanopelagicales bacterium]